MARYDSFYYNSGTLYGDTSGTTYSVAPFFVRALDYDNIVVSWNQPSNTPSSPYTRFRIVRNHQNPPETQEDGIIIVDDTAPFGSSITRVIDGTDVNNTGGRFVYFDDHKELIGFSSLDVPPITPGRWVYYAAWILRTDGGNTVWYRAGTVATLLAKNHYSLLGNTDDTIPDPHPSRTRTRTTQEKAMELLPRVYTSVSQSPLDTVDMTSDLYQFMEGLVYSYDEAMTFADLLLPNHTSEGLSRSLVNAKAYELAIGPDSQDSLKTQRALIRESRYIYSRKGTALATGTLVESMVGYNTYVVPFTNHMLSPQDSTFYKGVGNWVAGTGVTLTSDYAQSPPTDTSYDGDLYDSSNGSHYLIDTGYVGKVVTTGATQTISNGASSPTTLGVPVTAGQTYRLSFYDKKSSTNTITPAVTWYDYAGNVLSTSTGSAVSATSTWTKRTTDVTAPTDAVYATITLTFEVAGTYYLDCLMFAPRFTVTAASAANGTITYVAANTLSEGQRITITGLSTSAFNLTNATVESASSTQFTVRNPATGSAVSGASAAANHPYEEARAAAIKLSPSKVNYVTNPSFESGTTNWTATTTSTPSDSPDGLISGSKCLQATLSNSQPVYTVAEGGRLYGGEIIPGRWYTFSVYAKSTTADYDAEIYITATSGANTLTNSTSITLVNGVWQRYHVALFLPVDFTAPEFEAGIVGGSATTQVIRVDAAQIEPKYLPSDYFDGSYLIGGGEWEGGIANANDAISYLYENKPFRFPRLVAELPNYLPVNTPYLVESMDGVEFSGFSA